MIDGGIVERVFERGRPQTWPNTDDENEQLAALIKFGLAHEVKHRLSEVCRDCGTSHPVEQDKSGNWFTVCEAGHRWIDYDRLRQWTVAPCGLIRFIQGGIGVAQPADERLTGRFWYIGQANLGAGDFPVWLVRDCAQGQVVSSVQDSLEKRSPGERGIVIVCSEASRAVRWIRGSASVRLSDALVFRDGAWELSMPAFHLHAPPGKTPKGSPGAPKKNPKDIVQMFRDRVTTGFAIKTSLQKEAAAVRSILISEIGESKTQTQGRIENILSPIYRQWRYEGFKTKPPTT